MACNSFFLGLLRSFFSALLLAWTSSFTGKTLSKAAKATGRFFGASFVCSSFPSKAERDLSLSQSGIAVFLDKIASVPVGLLGRMSGALSQSLFGKLWAFLADKTEYILGLCFILFLAVPNHIWNNAYGLIAALLVFLIFLYRCAIRKDASVSFTGLDPAYFIFTLCLGACVINAFNVFDSARVFTIDLVPFIFVLIAVSLIRSQKQLNKVIFAILAGVTAASVYGIYQYAVGIPVDLTQIDVVASGYVPRVYSTMGNPNNLGEILVLFLPLFAYAIKGCKSLDGKVAVFAFAMLPVVNLVLSLSRSSWLGFAASLFLFVLILKPSLVPLLLIVAVLCIPIMPDFIVSRLLTINRDTSSEYRYTIWQSSINLLKDNPIAMVTGIGLGPAPYAYCMDAYMFSPPAHSHMLPLEILIETGIVGLGSFLWMALRFIRKTVAVKGEHRLLATCLLCGIGACTVVGCFEYIWFYPRVMWFFFISLGLLTCVLRPDFNKK